MTIERTVNGTVVTLKIVGRLDTTTAPVLEAAVDGCKADVKELILDCSALEYVSSAGLRVILKAQKQMNCWRLGITPIVLILIFLHRTQKIKFPCKWSADRVQ